MTFGSLFSGIGGIDLGLERAGMTCKWQVEIDPYCRRVLTKHWPHVPKHDDVKTFPPIGDWWVDLIAGGFPCQDISYAGKGAGLKGERSGLWFEFARIIREVRPTFVLVENVSALLVRGLDSVLGTLAADGYDCEWSCIPAAAVGAPHIRDRIFLLAYTRCKRGEPGREASNLGCEAGAGQSKEDQREWDGEAFNHRSSTVPNANGQRLSIRKKLNCGSIRSTIFASHRDNLNRCCSSQRWWAVEPELGRVADGISNRVDRLRGLGNAVVPQVAEWIGRRILESVSP